MSVAVCVAVQEMALRRREARHQRAVLRMARGRHLAADIQELLEEQGWMCVYCHEPLDDFWEIDHILPISRGGGDQTDNLAIACRPCNRSKGAKLLSEWKGREP